MFRVARLRRIARATPVKSPETFQLYNRLRARGFQLIGQCEQTDRDIISGNDNNGLPVCFKPIESISMPNCRGRV